MLTLPFGVGFTIAWIVWRKAQVILGNIVGASVIFGWAWFLVLLEYGELDILARACLDAGHVCSPSPSRFTRFGIYILIGVVEVAVLFMAGLRAEERKRDH